jgi:hypothetical protein
MTQPKQVINLGKYLESKDLTFSHVDDAGNYFVENLDGKKLKFDAPGFLKSKGVDPTKVDFSLNSPDAAIENSPVTSADRLKMSFGNEAGKIDFLKNKFEGVKYDPDGALIVKKNGVWHQVDPDGLGNGNAWEMTKELMADLADAAPTIGLIGASIGAGAVTGGTSLVAQAGAQAAAGGAIEGIRTSLGRALGTYKATAEEQVQDIGLEMLFNLGGTYVAAGAGAMAKGAKGYLVQKLAKSAQNLADAPPESQKLISQILGPMTVGADAVEGVIKNPVPVTGFLDDALRASNSEKQAADVLVEGQVNSLASIASKLPETMSKLYTTTVSKLMNEVPEEGFKSNLDTVHRGLFQDLMERGAVVVSKGKEVVTDLAGKNLDEMSIGIKSFDDFAKAAKASGMPDDIAGSKEAYSLFAEYVDFLNRMPKKNLAGKAGARQMMEFKRVFANKTRELSRRAYNSEVGYLGKLFTSADEAMDANIRQGFADSGLASKFDDIYGAYRTASREAAPLIEANRKLARGDGNVLQIFQPELNRILSGGGKNVANKKGLGFAVNLIDDKSVKESFDSIYHRETAKAFVPKFSSYLKPAAFLAASSVPYVASGGDPSALGFLGAGAALTSPRMIGRTLAKTSQASGLIQAGFKQLDFLKQSGKNQTRMLVDNPPLLNTFLQSGIRAFGVERQLKDELMSRAMDATNPQNTQFPMPEDK